MPGDAALCSPTITMDWCKVRINSTALLTRYRVISMNFCVPWRGYTADGFEDLSFTWQDKSRYVGGHGRFCDHRSFPDHTVRSRWYRMLPRLSLHRVTFISNEWRSFLKQCAELLERNPSSREARVSACFNTSVQIIDINSAVVPMREILVDSFRELRNRSPR